jgi:hypothetical protein
MPSGRRGIKKPPGDILRDDEIKLRGPKSKAAYPGVLRRVVALVELDGLKQEMVFLTNHLSWSPQSVADLYRCRWEIEKFFRQIKQTLQLADFLGNSENAVKWQIWTALLLHVLLRFQAFLSSWPSPFIRLWAICRSITWSKWELTLFASQLWDSRRVASFAGDRLLGLFARFGASPLKMAVGQHRPN